MLVIILIYQNQLNHIQLLHSTRKKNHDSKDEVKINHKQSSGSTHHNYYCNNHSKQFKRSLMDDGSAAQIFYAISKFSK